jgi:lipopolysaccharide export system permease protein
MGILTRYLIRAHVGPFLFAFTALTGLLFLNAVAQRMENLIGKGLSLEVIGEFLLLSLPHTVALTLPMATLVSVLYTFSQLTAGNEITAMSAGGIRPVRLLLPLLGIGAILALGMLYFNDEVLPESNHRLKNLIVDIGKKSPTLELREQVINPIRMESRRGSIYLLAREIDRVNDELTDVVIYDVSDPSAQRTTYADRGSMVFNEARTDLYLTLYDGVVLETRGDQIGDFNQSYFQEQVIPLRGVGTELERKQGAGYRSDREMSILMLMDEINARRGELERVQETTRDRGRDAVRDALGLFNPAEDRGGLTGATVTGPRLPARQVTTRQVPRPTRDDYTRSVAQGARQNVSQVNAIDRLIRQYKVEWHKKFAIAYAALVFILIGAPIAVRFPRGGVGMVIAVSAGIFAIYWAGLIGGENLADEGVVSPFIAMWTPDLVFTALGIHLVRGMGKEGVSQRGGGWDDLFWTMRRAFGSLLGRKPAPA